MSELLPNWLPSLNGLRAFDAVARHSSFQAAAEELNVTSAAVQQLVRGLEKTLDAALVVRDGRTLQLTARGKLATADFRDAFDALARGVDKIRRHTDRPALRLSVEQSFAANWLVERLTRFQSAHPNIDVLVESTDRLIDLTRGEADIAIRYSRGITDDVTVCPLFGDEIIAVCSPSLLPKGTSSLAPEDLKTCPLIHFEWPYGASKQINWPGWVRQMKFDISLPTGGLRFTDYNIALKSAIAGMGIALTSRPLVISALRSGLLVEPFGKGITNGYSYYLLVAPDVADTPEVKHFTNWILTEVAC